MNYLVTTVKLIGRGCSYDVNAMQCKPWPADKLWGCETINVRWVRIEEVPLSMDMYL